MSSLICLSPLLMAFIPMGNTIPTEVSLKTPSDYEAATEQCLVQMQRLHEQMERDQEDIDRLWTETKVLLAELKTG